MKGWRGLDWLVKRRACTLPYRASGGAFGRKRQRPLGRPFRNAACSAGTAYNGGRIVPDERMTMKCASDEAAVAARSPVVGDALAARVKLGEAFASQDIEGGSALLAKDLVVNTPGNRVAREEGGGGVANAVMRMRPMRRREGLRSVLSVA